MAAPPDAGRDLAVGSPDAPVPGPIAEMLHNRRHRTTGWTPVRVAAFIVKLGETGSVTRAAAYVRLSTVACYALRNHPDGAPFAAAWDDAVGARHEMLADIALDRVRNGVERSRFYKGEHVGFERVFSDRLLMFMLDRTDPHRRAGHRGRGPARGDPDDASALDRLLDAPDAAVQCTAAVPGAGPGGTAADDENPDVATAAALEDELAAESALSPEDEAMTAAFVARIEARVAASKAEQAEFDARVDAWLHPEKAK